MNKLLFLSCVIFLISINSKGQLQKVQLPDLKKIGQTKSTGVLIAELSYSDVKNDTSYTLLFNNEKYVHNTEFVTIRFESSPGILDTLYSILNNGFDLEKGKQSTFYLGKEFIAVNSEKSMGIKFIRILALDRKAYFYLRKKQLDELFNK